MNTRFGAFWRRNHAQNHTVDRGAEEEAWKEISMKTIQKAVDDFPKRLKKCIEANGGHFEDN